MVKKTTKRLGHGRWSTIIYYCYYYRTVAIAVVVFVFISGCLHMARESSSATCHLNTAANVKHIAILLLLLMKDAMR